MVDRVSRRNFVALAGTGVVLAGCSGSKKQSVAECASDEDETVPGSSNRDYKFLGYPAIPYGDNPHSQPPLPFDPQFISILHIADNGPWAYDINYAHFEVGKGLTDAARLQQAVGRIEKKIQPLRKESFRKLDDEKLRPHVKKRYDIGTICDFLEMEPLEFNSQNEIFIFIESKKIALVPDKLISFSNGLSNGDPAAENKSFYWARLAPKQDLGSLRSKGQMIRLRNYCLDQQGNSQVDVAEIKHSMNIHFGAPLKPRGFIPMVIDPDTGNGAGNEP